MRIPSSWFYSTITLLPIQCISFKKILDMIKQFRALYWRTFELKSFHVTTHKSKRRARNNMGKQMTFPGLTISQHCIVSITDLLQQPPHLGLEWYWQSHNEKVWGNSVSIYVAHPARRPIHKTKSTPLIANKGLDVIIHVW